MKNFLSFSFVLALLFLNIIKAPAQLNITQCSTPEDCIYKDSWTYLYVRNSQYELVTKDPVTGLTMSISIGSSSQEATSSLKQIESWFSTAKKESYLTINNNDRQISFIKRSGSEISITDGDPLWAIKERTRRTLIALGELESIVQKKESTPHLSYLNISAVKKMIKRVNSLT